MSSTQQTVQVYQLRIWIREISPQIWRSLLVRSDSTIAQLYDTLQIAFGWTDEHLHQFLIRGKPCSVFVGMEQAIAPNGLFPAIPTGQIALVLRSYSQSGRG